MKERRFRGSIYVDIYIEPTDDLEQDRDTAREFLKEIQEEIPNSYIGGVALVRDNLSNPLDREI